MTDVAALVLAGGGARRLGGIDKPLLEVGGRPMIARVIAALGTELIAISANGDVTRYAGFGCPVLADGEFVGEGPLAGLLAGLDWASGQGAAALLTVPADTPFIPAGLIGTLSPAPACAASNGRAHYLVALWPVACRTALRALLAAPGRRDIRHFADSLGMGRVDFPVLKWDPFLNVNTPEDLATARARAEDEG